MNYPTESHQWLEYGTDLYPHKSGSLLINWKCALNVGNNLTFLNVTAQWYASIFSNQYFLSFALCFCFVKYLFLIPQAEDKFICFWFSRIFSAGKWHVCSTHLPKTTLMISASLPTEEKTAYWRVYQIFEGFNRDPRRPEHIALHAITSDVTIHFKTRN